MALYLGDDETAPHRGSIPLPGKPLPSGSDGRTASSDDERPDASSDHDDSDD
jgi:hypothetical protein